MGIGEDQSLHVKVVTPFVPVAILHIICVIMMPLEAEYSKIKYEHMVSFLLSDIDPPKIKNCVHAVYAFANRNSTYGVVTWKQPTAIDNHDNNITVIKEGTISPGDVIAAGNYKVNYRATDSSGNQAAICTTNIVMKGINCST
jgi:hypothetical protein